MARTASTPLALSLIEIVASVKIAAPSPLASYPPSGTHDLEDPRSSHLLYGGFRASALCRAERAPVANAPHPGKGGGIKPKGGLRHQRAFATSNWKLHLADFLRVIGF